MKRSMTPALILMALLGTALAGMGGGDDSAARNYFTDIPLIDQNGTTHRLYSDLMRDHIVIVSAFFTSCDGICPVMAASIRKVQDAVGDRLGKDVNILSLTVDPVTDTPQRMKQFAQRFGAKPGWYFLTGARADLQTAQRKFGQAVKDKENHTSIVIVGNLKTGLWKKANGLADVNALIEIVQDVINDPGE